MIWAARDIYGTGQEYITLHATEQDAVKHYILCHLDELNKYSYGSVIIDDAAGRETIIHNLARLEDFEDSEDNKIVFVVNGSVEPDKIGYTNTFSFVIVKPPSNYYNRDYYTVRITSLETNYHDIAEWLWEEGYAEISKTISYL